MDTRTSASPSNARQDCPPRSPIELSELLTRAKAAIEQAREQIEKTHALVAESKENRQSESAQRLETASK